jgi:hypothetical protein
MRRFAVSVLELCRLLEDAFGIGFDAHTRIPCNAYCLPFLNTIKYILMFKEGLNHGSWFRLKNAVLTDARNIRSVQDGPGSTFLRDSLS